MKYDFSLLRKAAEETQPLLDTHLAATALKHLEGGEARGSVTAERSGFAKAQKHIDIA